MGMYVNPRPVDVEQHKADRSSESDRRLRILEGRTNVRDYWHEVGTTGEPAFQHSWVNYGGIYTTCAFVKDIAGFVHLKGAIKTGTVATDVFTLPAGYRPAKVTNMLCYAENPTVGFARLIIRADGTVYTDSGGNTFVCFDNMSFKAEA